MPAEEPVVTYYFGFATTKHLYLAADRRRVQEEPDRVVVDGSSKLHRVNPSTYLVGAGFMYFIDDLFAPQATSVFGSRPLDLQNVEAGLPKLGSQLRDGHAQACAQAGKLPTELHSRFTVVGISASSVPFSFEWNSDHGFQPIASGPHVFSLPRDAAELMELRSMIVDLQQRAGNGASWKDLVGCAANVIAWVAERDPSVSPNGDLVRLGGWWRRAAQFP